MEKNIEMKYMEFQMIKQQLDNMQNHLEKLDSQIMELEVLKTNLEELKNVNGDEEIMAPLHNGIFVKTKLSKDNKLLVNVGGHVVVEKTIEETKDMIVDQQTEIKKYHAELLNQVEELAHKAEATRLELSKLVK